MFAAAVAAVLVGFFTVAVKNLDEPVPVSVLPRTGGGLWVVLPYAGYAAKSLPASLRKLKPGPPALRKLVPQLAGKIVFSAVSEGTVGRLVIEDGVFVRAELGAAKCTSGVLLRQPLEKPRSKHGFTRVELIFVETDPVIGCEDPPPEKWQEKGVNAGVRLTFDATGRPVGVQLFGYMFSMVFLREGEKRPELLRMLASENDEEIGHQAE
jgi:hypothetical protein